MQIKKDIMWRIYGSFIFVCLFGFLILGQIVKIQFVDGPELLKLRDSLTLRNLPIPASRGNIYSSDGALLATSVPIYDIRMDTRADALTSEVFKENIDSLGYCLSQLFKDMSPAAYAQSIRSARARKERYYLIKRNVTFAQIQQLKKFPIFRLGRYKGGIRAEQKEMRELPFRHFASRTIGYMRQSNPVGIEAAFNDELKGISGERIMQRISGNIWMPVTDKEVKEPRNGNDLITTIDINIQGVAENSLESQLRSQNADHGCAVLMEVATGEIKAIANLSRTANGNYIEDFNYVISESTEPGSTMKMASLLAALDDGLIDPEDTIEVGNGTCYYSGHEMKDAHPPLKTRLSIQEAFETSSNVGISRVIRNAYAKNPQAFIDKLKSFGLNKKLGLQIEGEGSPNIKDAKDKSWSALTLPWMSIGYESSLTPLQILTFYNAIANNGKIVKPRFVKEIRNHGQLVREFPVQENSKAIASKDALAKARRMMEGVVQKGTATSLKDSPYLIAGKTGTAQIANAKYGYDKTHKSYQASFVGYFPADAPKYSCIVVVYSPSNNVYYGGAVAAPVFKEIADKVYANHLDLHSTSADSTSITFIPSAKVGNQRDLKKILTILEIPNTSKDEEAKIVSASSSKEGLLIAERTTNGGFVPDVKGMGMRDAIYLLENYGLRVICSGKGSVKSQSITPGTRIKKGDRIIIHLDI